MAEDWVKRAMETFGGVQEAPPPEIWRNRFDYWCESMAEFMRDKSRGGRCFETYTERGGDEFFSGGAIGYEGLLTKHPRAYVSLPIWVDAGPYRITTERMDERFVDHGYQAALEIDLKPGSAAVKKALEAEQERLASGKYRLRQYKRAIKDADGDIEVAYQEAIELAERQIARIEANLAAE